MDLHLARYSLSQPPSSATRLAVHAANCLAHAPCSAASSVSMAAPPQIHGKLRACLIGGCCFTAVGWRRRRVLRVRMNFFGGSDDTAKNDPGFMPPGTSKTLSSAVLTGSFFQRSLTPLNDPRKQRILVVGLTDGLIPLWLSHTIPDKKVVVDVLEIDQGVVDASISKFPDGTMRRLGGPSGSMTSDDGTPNDNAAIVANDVLDNPDGQTVRIYNVQDAEAFVTGLASALDLKDREAAAAAKAAEYGRKEAEARAKVTGDKVPDVVPVQTTAGYRYNMVFLDLDSCVAWQRELLEDPNGRFLQALNQILEPAATIGLNTVVDISDSGIDGEPEEVSTVVRNIREACCGTAADVFSVRPPDVASSNNKIYCFCCRGRPQWLRGGPSIRWNMQQSADKLNSDFPADALGKKIRFSLATQVTSCYQDWPTGKLITPDEPWLLYVLAAPLVAGLLVTLSRLSIFQGTPIEIDSPD